MKVLESDRSIFYRLGALFYLQSLQGRMYKLIAYIFTVFSFYELILGDNFPINWNDVIITKELIDTTSSEFGNCICDLTSNSCDSNCCCDEDCSTSEKLIFS